MNSQIRLGTLYRLELLSHLSFGRNQNGRRVLDVGCHDGYVLSHLHLPIKVGVDLDDAAHKLVAAANQAGGTDNITVLVLECRMN